MFKDLIEVKNTRSSKVSTFQSGPIFFDIENIGAQIRIIARFAELDASNYYIFLGILTLNWRLLSINKVKKLLENRMSIRHRDNNGLNISQVIVKSIFTWPREIFE